MHASVPTLKEINVEHILYDILVVNKLQNLPVLDIIG
jgi:hypothetical protein